MSTRQIKNARDLESNELIYFKSHAQATFMSDGSTVEDVINEMKEGVDVDLTDYVTTTQLNTSLSGKQDTISDLADIRSGASKGATAVQPASLSTVATSGSYNDLSNKPTIPTAVTINNVNKTISSNKINIGTIPTAVTINNSTKTGSTIALGTVVTGVTMNGSAKTVNNGKVDLGTIITAHQTLKTINGESIVGSGDITIEAGSSSSIIDETCKIYYTGTIDISLLPTVWGDAKILENRNVANAYYNGNTYSNYMKCLIFDKPLVAIPQNAFSNQSDLVTIYLPATLQTIGANAFTGCGNLLYIDAKYYNGTFSAAINNDIFPNAIIIGASTNINSDISRYNAFYADNYADKINAFITNAHGIPYKNYLTTAYSTAAIPSGSTLLSIPNYIMKYKVALPTSGSVTLSPSNNSGIVFTMGATACQIVLNGTWQWVNGEAPIFESENTYEISFYNGRAACVKYL